MVRVRVRLFGAFRQYSNGSEVALDVPPGTTVSALRGLLGDALRGASPAFDGQALLDVSAVADDEEILDDAAPLDAPVSLAILPPVCGG